LWEYLKKSKKPIVLYGTGNAAERIIAELNARNIRISGIFASDGFVRKRTFAGYDVISYSEAKEKFGDMTVLLCFGSHLESVIENIKKIASEQELYAPDLPVVGEGLFTADYFKEHEKEIDHLRTILADDKSREVLNNLIEYRLSGKIEYLFRADTPDAENWNLLKLSDEEIYMDLGAYTGDTVSDFLSQVNSYKSIYAVEPEDRNFRKLGENTAGLENIQLIQAAIGGEPGEIMFTHGVGRGGARGKGKTRPVPMETVDHILGGKVATFIKMDLEGEELQAIEGARNTISTYSPQLLIAAYHRIADFWEIPEKVLSCSSDYRVYLRKSPCLPCWEVNYYFSKR